MSGMKVIGGNAKQALLNFIERIEVLIDQRKEINGDIKDVLAEAEATGLDKRTIREMIKLRALDPEVRIEREALRDVYMNGLDLV
jgi:uncharacterized protein (UPF0335 family)